MRMDAGTPGKEWFKMRIESLRLKNYKSKEKLEHKKYNNIRDDYHFH